MQQQNTDRPYSALSNFHRVNTPDEDTTDCTETILSYQNYLTDSLNPARPDTVFQFALKPVTFTEDSPAKTKSEQIYPSFISSKTSENTRDTQIIREVVNNDWITIFIFLSIGLLAWVKHYYPRRLKQILLATYAKRYSGQLIRDGNLTRERITPALGFITTISYTTILYGFTTKLTDINFFTKGSIKIFFFIAAALILFWFFRRIFIALTGFIYKSQTATSVFQLNNLLFNLTTGVILFPLAIGWFFTTSDVLLYAGAVIILISLLVRFYRNLIGGLQVQSFSGIYFFLYFCTLEILPLAIGFKLYKILMQ